MKPLSALAARAEAFLFVEGGPISFKRLAQLLDASESEARAAASELASFLEGSGLSLVATGREASLATAPGVSEAVKSFFEDQLQRDIGDAGLEVLAIVLYRGPSTRAAIEYIRGVNTGSTIRSLLARQLLARSPNPSDAREYFYRPTAELLAHLGVRSVEEAPEYATIRAELGAFEKTSAPAEPHDRTDGNEIRA